MDGGNDDNNHNEHSHSTSNSNDTAPITEDLYAFTSQIEKKLKSNYSSLDLTKSITSPTITTSIAKAGTNNNNNTNTNNNNNGSNSAFHQNSNGPSSSSSSTTPTLTPGRFVHLLSKCLPNMEKSIQLRAVISFLGLDPEVGHLFNNTSTSESSSSSSNTTTERDANDEFHKIVLEALDKATLGNGTTGALGVDPWVKVISNIVLTKLFHPSTNSQNTNKTNTNDEYKKRTKKTIDSILQTTLQSSSTSHELYSQAEIALCQQEEESGTNVDDDEQEEDRRERERDRLLKSFYFSEMEEGRDVFYVPFYYRLANRVLVKEVIPNVFPPDDDDDDENDGDGEDEGEIDETEKKKKDDTIPKGIEGLKDFVVARDADILNVDRNMDREKALDELKELEQKERAKALVEQRKKERLLKLEQMKKENGGGGVNAAARTTTSGKSGELPRMVMAGMNKRKTMASAAVGAGGSALAKSKALGRGSAAAAIGGGRGGGKLTANGLGRGRMGLGRGAAANAIGGKSLANPAFRRSQLAKAQPLRRGGAKPMISKTMGSGRGKLSVGGGKLGGGGSGASSRAGSSAGVFGEVRTKMKTIDTNEVATLHEERKQVLEKEEINNQKMSKKRKLMQKGAKATLKSKERKKGDSNTSSTLGTKMGGQDVVDIKANDGMPKEKKIKLENNEGIMHEQQNGAMPSQVPPSQQMHLEPTNVYDPHMAPVKQEENVHGIQPQHQIQGQINPNQATMPMHTNYNQQPINSIPQPMMMPLDPNAHAHPAQLPPSEPHQNWGQLLVRSNKLSPEDRSRVEQFFTNRFNPTPDVPVYKMKLHEEKSIDPVTGQTIKETLYLQLDYNTLDFKQLRKIKKK